MIGAPRLAPPAAGTGDGEGGEAAPAPAIPRPPLAVLRSPLHWAGRLRAAWWAEDCRRPRWQDWLWTLALIALLGWMAARVGAFDWYTDYPATAPDGGLVRLPHTYASIDHPAHLARERATVDALRDGRLPRWISNVQGGFPTEFYPVGGGVLVALVHLLTFGLIPLGVAHKLVVVAVFFLPPLAYWALARRERLPLSVAALAAVIHLFLRGEWYGGGSRELIDYGLWPNVLAAYLTLFLLLWGADWLRFGDRRALALATATATLAFYANPRSALAIAATCLAAGLVALAERVRLRRRRRAEGGGRKAEGSAPERPVASPQALVLARFLSALRPPPSALRLPGRAALLTLLVGLLSAALVLPLRAHQDLYSFTIYVEFDGPRDAWRWLNDAVGFPRVLHLAGLGIAVALLRRGFYPRALALQALLSYLAIVLVGWQWKDWPVFAQLEGPRLMTTLRPALVFLAAFGIHELARAAIRLVLADILARLRLRRAATWATTLASLLVGVTAVGCAWFTLAWDRSTLDRERRGLPLLETTNQPAFTAIAESTLRFAAAATPADKPLIMGNPISWHASFWVPALTGRDAFHNDYLWFWRKTDYADKELLQDERWAIGREFLDQHNLTMVLIDVGRGDLIDLADSLPHLQRLYVGRPGGYSVYRVAPADPARGLPNGWVSLSDGAVTAVDARPERLTARGQAAQPGTAWIIINDYPRWRARVNGAPAPIARTPDGYMAVPVPAGEVTIELDYVTEPVGWLARGLVALGLLLLGALTWRAFLPRPRRWKTVWRRPLRVSQARARPG